MLPTSYVSSKELRELRELVRLHTYLVRERTRFKSKIRAELAKRGIRFTKSPFAKRRIPLLRELGIVAVDNCLSMIGVLNERIREVSAKLEQKASESEEAKSLMTVPDVGYFSALAILAEIGDISRFSDAEKLCGYAGLVPSVHQSCATRRYGRITKQGSGMLRWALLECVWVHLQYDTRPARFFYRVVRRKGKKATAVVAARKLLVAIYCMLRNREEFRT